MNKKIRHIVNVLRAQGDRGTANAIVDAFAILARAKLMLARSEAIYNHTEYYAEEQMAQIRIDILRELLDTDD